MKSPSYFPTLIFCAASLVCSVLLVADAEAVVYYSYIGSQSTNNVASHIDTGQTFNSGVVYIGFDAQRTAPTGSAVNTFAGVQLGMNATIHSGGDLAFGNPWPSDNWGWFEEGGSYGDYAPATPVGDSLHRIVGKLDFTTGTSTMFIDPTEAIELNNPFSAAGATNDFRYLHVRSGNDGVAYTWSNFIIADSFSEAAGITAVPEPSTLLLGIAGVFGLAWCYRRHRQR